MKKLLLLLVALVAFASLPFTAQGSSQAPATSPNQYPSAPFAQGPGYDGFFDGADCNSIWGWAWDSYIPNVPISVDIDKDSVFYKTVRASNFRQDLFNAGKGNGRHAFSMPVPASWRDGVWHFISAYFAGTSEGLPGSPRWIICDASMFPTQTPNSEASGEGRTWEQATHFYSSTAGFVTHIRFYKHCSESGTHVGWLWSDTGTPLGRAPFTKETPCGWQTAKMDSPVAISAGVRYRVSYNANFYVAKTWNVFGTITNGPLTAYGASYSTPAGSFPTTGSSSNLFADVLFESRR